MTGALSAAFLSGLRPAPASDASRQQASLVAVFAGWFARVPCCAFHANVRLNLVARVAAYPLQLERSMPNNALLTDSFSSLRYACGAAKRGR
jgi:hypothetical protein